MQSLFLEMNTELKAVYEAVRGLLNPKDTYLLLISIKGLMDDMYRAYPEAIPVIEFLEESITMTATEIEQIGIVKGEQRKALEIARNLIGRLDVEDIAASTGLSIEEVRALRPKV